MSSTSLLASPHLTIKIITTELNRSSLTPSDEQRSPTSDVNLQRVDKNIQFSVVSTQNPDSWLGQDKALHFGVSTAIAGGASLASQNSWLGLGICLGIGLAKELIYDQVVPNHTSSYKDMVANTLGCGVGALAGHWLTR